MPDTDVPVSSHQETDLAPRSEMLLRRYADLTRLPLDAKKTAHQTGGLAMGTKAFSFGGGPCPDTHEQIGPDSAFDDAHGFGWTDHETLQTQDRGTADVLGRGFTVSRSPATFRIATGPGLFRVECLIGDTTRGGYTTQLLVPGNDDPIPLLNAIRGEHVTVIVTAEVTGPTLDIGFSSPRSTWLINALSVTPAERREPLWLTRRLESRWALPEQTRRGPRSLIGRWRQHPASDIDPVPSGLTRADYLRTIAQGVEHFRHFQEPDGGILDVVMGKELYYSTPGFAYAAALVASATGNADLIEPAAEAFDCASRALIERKTPSAHEDFFVTPLAHAFPLLAPLVKAERSERWRAELGAMNPFTIYRSRPGGALAPGTNWNCLALSGDFRLHQLGIRADAAFSENSLKGQGLVFQNEFGLYAEGPMTYDAFPRAWLADMLEAGYRGPAAEELAEALDRGALTSLLMQSANGEIPCGGRSSQHQWSDALQVAIFEIAAARSLRVGDPSLASTFKRAARRAYAAFLPWQRLSGEFQIVKNRADPMDRLGWENYSAHSTYNLLMLTALGFAYEHAGATEHLAERATPAETGGHATVLGEPFHKVVAAAAGTSAVVCTAPQAGQTPAGLVRVQFEGLIGGPLPGDASLAKPSYRLPAGPREGAVIGLAWRLPDGTIQSLADVLAADLSSSVTILREDPAVVRFRVEYRVAGPAPLAFAEVYELSARQTSVRFEVPADGPPMLLRWPVFAGDGAREADIATHGTGVSVAFAGRQVEYRVEGTESPVVGETLLAHRNGYVRLAEAALRDRDGLRLVVLLVR